MVAFVDSMSRPCATKIRSTISGRHPAKNEQFFLKKLRPIPSAYLDPPAVFPS